MAQEEVRKYLLEMEREDHPDYVSGDSPKTLERAIRARLLPEDYEQEVYGFVAMTCRLRVLKVETVFRGGQYRCSCEPGDSASQDSGCGGRCQLRGDVPYASLGRDVALPWGCGTASVAGRDVLDAEYSVRGSPHSGCGVYVVVC